MDSFHKPISFQVLITCYIAFLIGIFYPVKTKIVIILRICELWFFFSKYDREVMGVFQIREHHAKIVKLGRYDSVCELFHYVDTSVKLTNL